MGMRKKTEETWKSKQFLRILVGGESRSVLSSSATPWTTQSVEFSRPEYWNGSLSLHQGIFPTQESNQLGSPALQVESLPTELPGKMPGLKLKNNLYFLICFSFAFLGVKIILKHYSE